MQREMPFFTDLRALQWVDSETVRSWTTWRDAVLWCWEHRTNGEGKELGDQAMFRHFAAKLFKQRIHAPHISRWVNPHTRAPMDLPQDLVPAFETFTGWRGLTQRFARTVGATVLEELQARAA